MRLHLLCGKSSDSSNDTPTKQEQARQIILDLLSNAGDVSSDALDRVAGENGISKRTVRLAKADLREEGLLGSRKVELQWFHFLAENEEPPDWTDQKQRLKKMSVILGVSHVDITEQICPNELQE